MTKFNVTYEVYPAPTDEDEESCGENTKAGFIAEGVRLAEAIYLVNETESSHCSQSFIEASDSRIEDANWITVYNSANWDDGETENRSLHIPDSVTGASRKRIARLLGISR
jgi:hypothetical protein